MTGPATRKKILVIYTGGTIGMKRNKNGVYVPQPNQFINKIAQYSEFHDKSYAENNDVGDFFVIPKISKYVNLLYKIVEYNPLLDSSNMGPKEWVRIATDIEKNYYNYDGFVILHGTDTLSYTSSALSFILEGLKKPVIVTGAQISIFEGHSDAKENFLSSLHYASCFDIPEVCVCFAHKLFRGNRTVKYSSNKINAFKSPSSHFLGEAGIEFKIYPDYFWTDNIKRKFKVYKKFSEHVGIITMHPTICAKNFKAILEPPTEGLVLQSYGIGNIPSNREEINEILTNAVNRGVIIINISQCTQGCVNIEYEPGRVLAECGVLIGHDMTLEAAVTKLAWVLELNLSLEEKKKLMLKNVRGELTELNVS